MARKNAQPVGRALQSLRKDYNQPVKRFCSRQSRCQSHRAQAGAAALGFSIFAVFSLAAAGLQIYLMNKSKTKDVYSNLVDSKLVQQVNDDALARSLDIRRAYLAAAPTPPALRQAVLLGYACNLTPLSTAAPEVPGVNSLGQNVKFYCRTVTPAQPGAAVSLLISVVNASSGKPLSARALLSL